MNVQVLASRLEMARAAAEQGAACIREAIDRRGAAAIILATGQSQIEMLTALSQAPDIAWHRVGAFHLDEYVGLPITHAASFRQFLWQRFVRHLPLPLASFHYLSGEGDLKGVCEAADAAIRRQAIDVAFVGIGENGHLAFNDPPADFETTDSFRIVELDEACRRQQLGEGWFSRLDEVPGLAISMSIWRIMQSQEILCTVPDLRKADAVQKALEGPVTPQVPASILQQHPRTTVYLDRESASRLANP